MEQLQTEQPEFEGYVSAEACIRILFPGERPGISLRHFRSLQSAGAIPFLKLGRRTLFLPSEVKAALERKFKVRAYQHNTKQKGN
jgi:hypothetical protein